MSTADRPVPLEAGDLAPDFALLTQHREPFALSDYRRRKLVLLAFHSMCFTETSRADLSALQDALTQFDLLETQVVGLSVDSWRVQRAWAEFVEVTFPLAADFFPHGRVAQMYGVFRERDGTLERALFLIDKDGRIRWARHYPPSAEIDTVEVLTVVERVARETWPAT